MTEQQPDFPPRDAIQKVDQLIPGEASDTHSSGNVLSEIHSKSVVSLPPIRSGSYYAALLLMSSIIPVPFVAMIITTAIYISPWKPLLFIIPELASSWVAIITGLAITITLWLFLAFLFRLATTVDIMNPSSSNHIRSHLLSLKATFTTVQKVHSAYRSEQQTLTIQPSFEKGTIISLRERYTNYYDSVTEETGDYLTEIDKELRSGGLRWVSGSGYLNAWHFIHRAEEAILDIAPVEEVIKEALHDELSIEGSAIGGRNNILNKLRIAVKKLSPTAGIYLKPPIMADANFSPSKESHSDKTRTADNKEEMEARNAIRDAKRTLNEFQDTLWNGLIRVRNQLIGTALITGFLSYLLLSIAILAGATIPAIETASIFYLVGGLIGLFGRLYTEFQTDNTIDDYGLTVARIIVTPIISGLAALAGVLVVNLFSAKLENIYSLDQNLKGLIIAAIFGLIPDLFINMLQKKTDNIKTQLKDSSASA